MTILPTLVNPVPLPAPVTSGSGVQSYTDPMGDVWVAANGANGGAWRRARDVLFARYYRTNPYTMPNTAWLTVAMDFKQWDDYSLYNTSNGVGTFPIAGLWRVTMAFSAVATAVNQYVQTGIWDGALTAPMAVSGIGTISAYGHGAPVVLLSKFNAGDSIATRGLTAPGLAINLPASTLGKTGTNYVELKYEGTG
jgi:hypothetical protein